MYGLFLELRIIESQELNVLLVLFVRENCTLAIKNANKLRPLELYLNLLCRKIYFYKTKMNSHNVIRIQYFHVFLTDRDAECC